MAGDSRSLGSLVENLDFRRTPLSKSERQLRKGTVPYYGPTGIIDHVDTHIFEGLHLLLAEDGSVERPDGTIFRLLVDGRFWVNNHTHVVRCSRDVDTKYLYYALSQRPIRPFISGSVQDKLTQASLNGIPVRFPTAPEREAVVELLGSLDEKIETNCRLAQTLEAMARALFKSWFVDFDPVNAKAAGRPTGLPDDLAALFPARFAEDGMPDGWTARLLGQVAAQDRGTVDPATLGETHVEHFSLPAFDVGRRPSIEPASSIRSLKLNLGVPLVLFSKLNPATPRVWVVHNQASRPMLASTEFVALRPSSPDVPLAFIEGLLTSDRFREKASGMVTGTSKSHQRVQPADLLRTECLMPPVSVLNAYGAIATSALARRALLSDQSAALADLRDTLLPKLISGELRIIDAERTVAAA